MNWLELTDEKILKIANPIMDDLMKASTDVNYEKHVTHFSEKLKGIVSKVNFENQCKEYQENLGFFSKREFVGIFKKESDVRIFWRQYYTNSKNQFLAFLHLIVNNDKVEIVNVSVS